MNTVALVVIGFASASLVLLRRLIGRSYSLSLSLTRRLVMVALSRSFARSWIHFASQLCRSVLSQKVSMVMLLRMHLMTISRRQH